MVQALNQKAYGGNVVLKLDIEKAFDKLEWRFLWSILVLFGLNTEWINFLRRCPTNGTSVVLFQGSYDSFFETSRG